MRLVEFPQFDTLTYMTSQFSSLSFSTFHFVHCWTNSFSLDFLYAVYYTILMICPQVVHEAVEMTSQGASTKDLYTRLFVPKDEFISWFAHGHELVNQGYGRYSIIDLEAEEDIAEFDILCLELYRGVVKERWEIKKEIHELVAKSESPTVAFKYLEAVYRTEFNPKFVEEEDVVEESGAESSTSYVLSSFFSDDKVDAETRESDSEFPEQEKLDAE